MTDKPSIEGLRQAISRIEIPEDQYALYRAAVLAGDLLLPVLGVEEACDKALLQVRQGVQPPADELLEAGLVEQAFTDELEALRERDQRAGLLALRLDTAARASRDEAYAEVEALRAENEALRAELERERIRLAACGVLAQSNTPESLARNRVMEASCWSASADDVWRAVEGEMAERARADALAASSAVIYGKLQLARELIQELRGYTEHWNWKYCSRRRSAASGLKSSGARWDEEEAATYHDPAQTSTDLEARDARVKREALESFLDVLSEWRTPGADPGERPTLSTLQLNSIRAILGTAASEPEGGE